MDTKEREILHTFFSISVATFEFTYSIIDSFKQPRKHTEIYELHKKAKLELEKEKPDEQTVLQIIHKLQILAELQSNKN